MFVVGFENPTGGAICTTKCRDNGPSVEPTATAARVGPYSQPTCSPKRRDLADWPGCQMRHLTGCSDLTSLRPTEAACKDITQIEA